MGGHPFGEVPHHGAEGLDPVAQDKGNDLNGVGPVMTAFTASVAEWTPPVTARETGRRP